MGELEKLRGLQFGLFAGRLVLAVLLLSMIASRFLDWQAATALVVGLIALGAVLGRFWIKRMYQFIEKSFQKNLTEKERKELVSSDVARKFLPWEASLGVFDICRESILVGKSLRDASFK